MADPDRSYGAGVGPNPSVNLAVCGTFHYRHYVRHLERAGVLGRFYYSHKVSTDARALGLSAERAVNLPAKEYLTHLHLKAISHRLGDFAFPAYQTLWQRQLVRRWRDADLLHVMLHGAGGEVIRQARARGSAVLGEPVNSHPEVMQELLRQEHDRLGLSDRTVRGLNTGQRRTVDEAAACDFLLAPSRFVARSYVERGFPEARTFVEPWGTDLSRFRPGPRPDDGVFRVLCVSQVAVRKGHVDLVRAWERLRLPKSELVFVGAMTPEMSRVLGPDRGLFTYAGTVPHAELAAQFHRADVVVQPSIEDGFSYVPLEAMASGLPVIVTENVGASELVAPGETGYVVPIRSPDRIAERLSELYADSDRRRAMGAAAAARTRRGLGWGEYAGRVVPIYRAAAGTAAAGTAAAGTGTAGTAAAGTGTAGTGT